MQAIRLISFLIMNFGLGSMLMAQNYILAPDSAIIITVTGTSTLHGWTVTANEVKEVPINLKLSGENENTIENFNFEVTVNSLDGGRGASMNKKIIAALKGTEHPVISYQQNNLAIIMTSELSGKQLTSKGKMNIAGVEQEAIIDVAVEKNKDGLIFKGSKPMKFSELNIEPPSAMFGQIVCGDDIAINFEFRYILK